MYYRSSYSSATLIAMGVGFALLAGVAAVKVPPMMGIRTQYSSYTTADDVKPLQYSSRFVRAMRTTQNAVLEAIGSPRRY